MILPIGIDKPHAGWKSSEHWSRHFLTDIDNILTTDIKDILKYRLGIGHTGHKDGRTCFKYIKDEIE